MSVERLPSRFPVGRMAAVFVLLSLVPLGLLTYFSLTLASDAVHREVERRINSNAALSADVVRGDMQGLTQLVSSYAQRPSLISALADGVRTPRDRAFVRLNLRDLQRARRGIPSTGLVAPDGRLIEIVPATPSIVGTNFSFRDWYKGVTRTGRPYVSEAFRSKATDQPLVVTAATLVRDSHGRVRGILVAGYTLEHIQRFIDQLALVQHVELKLTDQRGNLIAAPGGVPKQLVSPGHDAPVAAALKGRKGITEVDTPDGRRLAAYTPVPGVGWTITASVPANTAFEAVDKLRSAVLTIVAILGAVLLGGLVLLLRTLRGRRRAEGETRRMVDINRAVLDSTRDTIFLVDPQGKLLLKNAALDRVTEGRSEEEWTEGSVYDHLLAGAERMVNTEEWRRSVEEIAANPHLETDVQVERTDGTTFHMYTAPVSDGAGGLLGRIVVGRDKTSEHEAERLKSELVATVSHELRTPLASIVGFAELLIDRDVDDDTRERYIATIHSEARRLTNLVNDFLDLQRIEEGGFTLALEPFELGEVLREERDLFRGQSTKHEIDLDAPEEPMSVLGERNRIAQVTANLISNAIKYSPGGGRVEVRAEPRGSVVRVSVSDEGLGIPSDQQRLLFTKFFRVDTSDTREIGGTGLGLALCREIVEAHGGRIGFDSAEGEGSTFWFEVPAPQRGNGEGRHRVLVIEDDPAAANLLAEYIGVNGYEVEIVATGEQGFERAIENPPGLICLDIGLPGELDGWQLLARLRERADTAEVPVIICTGRNGRDNASALGIADFITKPFSQRQIREAVARLLPEGRGAVLVVDDDPAVRRLVVETLRSRGVELREAADGESALAEIAARMPDAVVLDLIMPGIDGFTVLERLQADPETKLLPVIVLTARRLSADERSLLRERAVSLLEKSSYSPAELRRLVDRALGQ